MILTRRGSVLVVVVVAAILSGVFFGARGLNGIAAPGIVALIAGVIQVTRYRPPTIERTVAPSGHRGDTLRVTLRLTADRPFSGTVTELVSGGLNADDADRTGTIADTTYHYDLDLDSRGEWTIGPTRVVARDVLGLVATSFDVGSPDTVLVYPAVLDLEGRRRHDITRLYGGSGHDRQEFDQLRQYERGDSMRDIHWKSSAKRSPEEFIVKQYTADAQSQTVHIVADAPDGRADAMADATASIAAFLLERSIPVGVTTPGGRVPPDDGPEQRRRILRHLAFTTAGTVPQRRTVGGDIRIRTASQRTVVDLNQQQVMFEDLVGGRVDRVRDERWQVRSRPTDPLGRVEEAA